MIKNLNQWLSVLLIFGILLGTAYSVVAGIKKDEEMRAEILTEMHLASLGIATDQIQNLTGTEDDLDSSEYRSIKKYLINICISKPEYRFTSLMGRRTNGTVIFFVDSEPDTSSDYSPPGHTYPEVTDTLLWVFSHGRKSTNGPAADRRGVWVSGFIPLIDHQNGRVIAILKVDIDSSGWTAKVIQAMMVPGVITLLLLCLLIFFIIIQRYSDQETARLIRSEALIRESEKRYRLLADNATDVIWTMDHSDLLTYVSPSISLLLGFSSEDSVEESLNLLFHPSTLYIANETRFRKNNDAQSDSLHPEVIELELIRKDGSRVWTETVSRLFCNMSGRKDGIIGITRDITKRKQVEDVLRASEVSLAEAQNIAHIGSWEWNMISNTVKCSDEMYRISGISPDTFDGNPESVVKVIHPDDKERFVRNMEVNLSKGKWLPIEYRVILPDGSERIIIAKGMLVFDKSGVPIKNICTVQDITEQKVTEDQLRVLVHEKQILLTEVHHRVRNILQLLTVIMKKTRKNQSEMVNSALLMVENRLATVSFTFDRIYRSDDLTKVRFHGVMISLVSRLQKEYKLDPRRIRVNIHAKVFALSIDRVVPLALLANELIANAAIHAFPYGREGTITVQLKEEGDHMVLKVSDDGIGLPAGFDPLKSDTVGCTIIRITTEQVNGELIVESNASGTNFTIIIPWD